MTTYGDIPGEAVELLAARLNETINPNARWADLVAEENPCVDVIRIIAGGHLQAIAPALRKQGVEEALNALKEAANISDALFAQVRQQGFREGEQQGLEGYDLASAREAGEAKRADKAEAERDQALAKGAEGSKPAVETLACDHYNWTQNRDSKSPWIHASEEAKEQSRKWARHRLSTIAPAIRTQARREGAEEERELLRELLNDTPEKLRLLADWFDTEQAKGRWGGGEDVQHDLRKLAAALDTPISSERERCARDSDWCDGKRCKEMGIDCPNADSAPSEPEESEDA